ncbi:MAG: hypothetical protein V4640_15345 [Verrucomicrobiota bacterium]
MKAWFGTLDSGALKNGAIDHVYWRLKRMDLDDASRWVAERAGEGSDTRRINRELVADHVATDPLKGLNWYLTIPDVSQETEAFEKLLEAAERNPEAFQKWRSTSEFSEKLLDAERRLGNGASSRSGERP